jgi:hypothetical protein
MQKILTFFKVMRRRQLVIRKLYMVGSCLVKHLGSDFDPELQFRAQATI